MRPAATVASPPSGADDHETTESLGVEYTWSMLLRFGGPRLLVLVVLLATIWAASPLGAQAVLTCGGMVVTVDIAQGEQSTEGADVIRGTSGDDLIDGLGGADTICALGGDDQVVGGDGFDRIFAGAGSDRILGGAGNDRIAAGPGFDVVSGGAGNDRIQGGDGPDVLRGDGGYDRISGGSGDDNISGGTHDDTLFGNLGRDSLFGNGGDDILRGGAWRDTLNGGNGTNDACTLTDPGGLTEIRIDCERGVSDTMVTTPVNLWATMLATGQADDFAAIGGALGLDEAVEPAIDENGNPIEWTLFAPNDAAMARAELTTLLTDQDNATAVLGYHFLNESYSNEDLRAIDGQNVQTVTGLPMQISIVDGDLLLNGTSRVVSSVTATNGTVHIVDTFLTPPAVGATTR